MDAHRSTYTEATMRDAAIVMAAERLGAMHQNRIISDAYFSAADTMADLFNRIDHSV